MKRPFGAADMCMATPLTTPNFHVTWFGRCETKTMVIMFLTPRLRTSLLWKLTPSSGHCVRIQHFYDAFAFESHLSINQTGCSRTFWPWRRWAAGWSQYHIASCSSERMGRPSGTPYWSICQDGQSSTCACWCHSDCPKWRGHYISEVKVSVDLRLNNQTAPLQSVMHLPKNCYPHHRLMIWSSMNSRVRHIARWGLNLLSAMRSWTEAGRGFDRLLPLEGAGH